MGRIYKVTNLINGHIYIGQTKYSIQRRWKKHISDSYDEKKSNKNSYFHSAIRKYGVNNFKIELVEECEDDFLNERERFWIFTLKSYVGLKDSVGYNLTLGGEGVKKYNSNIFRELWDKGHTAIEISHIIGCSIQTARSMVQNFAGYDSRVKNQRKIICTRINKEKNKPIDVYDLNGKFIKTYQSQVEAAQELDLDRGNISAVLSKRTPSVGGYQMVYQGETPPKYTSRIKVVCQFDKQGNFIKKHKNAEEAAKSVNGDRSLISHCCRGERKSAYGYVWTYQEEDK